MERRALEAGILITRSWRFTWGKDDQVPARIRYRRPTPPISRRRPRHDRRPNWHISSQFRFAPISANHESFADAQNPTVNRAGFPGGSNS
jgi:hypothetical protein